MKTTFLLIFLIVFGFYSCSSDQEQILSSTSENIQKLMEDSLNKGDEAILPMEGIRDTLQRPPVSKTSYDDYIEFKRGLDQLDNIPFYLKVKGNSTSKQFLNATNKGSELTVQTYKANSNQQFYIKVLPASSGIPYLIYSKQTNTPIRVGAYASSPNVKVLYASQDVSGTLFGASWDFRQGEYSPESYVIENQDYPQQGSSGLWYDIYYNVISVNDAKISFSKYTKSPRQEFEIIPVETFQIQSIKFNIDASAVLTKLPEIVLIDRFTNNGPVDQTHKFTLTEIITETSTFTRKTTYNVSASTEIKAKVPFIASGKITTSISFGQEYTYGRSESLSRTISREYPIVVPAGYNAEVTLSLLKYNMDVEYEATCRGLTSGKIITIKGRWTGVNVQEADAIASITPIAGGTKTSKVLTQTVLKSESPIKIK